MKLVISDNSIIHLLARYILGVTMMAYGLIKIFQIQFALPSEIYNYELKRISFTIGYESKVLKLTSEFGKRAGARSALNGTFFDTKEGGSVDFIKAGGQIINPNRMENNKRAAHQKAALAIEKGRLTIEKWNGRAEWETEMQADEIMVSGPLLIFQQRPEELDSSSFNITRHPRTAVAITASNRILLITVDGRNENAAGMSLFELRNILRWLNTRHGINLDGGGSTTLWIYNQPDDGVVNYPCDNRKWDHAELPRV